LYTSSKIAFPCSDYLFSNCSNNEIYIHFFNKSYEKIKTILIDLIPEDKFD